MIHAVLAVCVEIPVRLEDQSISEFPLCIGYLGRKLDEMIVISFRLFAMGCETIPFSLVFIVTIRAE